MSESAFNDHPMPPGMKILDARPIPPGAIEAGMLNLALERQFRRERAIEVERERREKLIVKGLERLSRDYFGGVL